MLSKNAFQVKKQRLYLPFNDNLRRLSVQEVESELDRKLPHLLKYMGSKREIIDFVKESILSLEVRDGWLCDLFAGTGIVSGSLKGEYNIHANDVQEYSSILSYTYLANLKENISPHAISEIYDKVFCLVNEFREKKRNLIFDYSSLSSFEQFKLIEEQQQLLINENFDLGFHLFAKYYSGTYWSFDQCVWIDSIRAVAEQYKGRLEYYAILSSLIFSMSYASQSTGHYAQFRDATADNMNDILIYRKKEIWANFEKKFIDITQKINGITREFRVTTLDFIDCLRIIESNSIIYADPPYQSVHYSRFYHALETLVKYDYPKVHYKGRYRDDRHQSPFCKKTTVKKAFSTLFKAVESKKSHLVLSYSDTGMISLEEIQKLGKQFLSKYDSSVLAKDHIHSKMGRSDIRNQEVTEYSIIFKRR